MRRIEAKVVTATPTKRLQREWFEAQGITYKVDTKGHIYTTDDWMNGKDKYKASNDDGFNIGDFDHAS
jgi:hypothetical protein